MDLDRMKKNIRALLDTGADETLLAGETENALRFARRLMLKHNVSDEDLEEARGADQVQADAEATEYGVANAELSGAATAHWENLLGHATVKLFGTMQFYIDGGCYIARSATGATLFGANGKAKYVRRFVFYGPAADSAAAAELFEEWRVTIAALGRLKFGGALRGPGRSYCEGFTRGLLEVLQTQDCEERALELAQYTGEELPEGATRSTALMVLNARAVMAAKQLRGSKWLQNEHGIRLGRGRSSGGGGLHHGDAHGAGRADGKASKFSRGSSAKRPR